MSWLAWALLVAFAAAVFYFAEGWVSGLTRLARTYPAGAERVLRSQSLLSGEFGWFWTCWGTLTLKTCERGLMVAVWLRSPFVVPWHDIRVEGPEGHRMTQLVFGKLEAGRLRISSRTWALLWAARGEAAA